MGKNKDVKTFVHKCNELFKVLNQMCSDQHQVSKLLCYVFLPHIWLHVTFSPLFYFLPSKKFMLTCFVLCIIGRVLIKDGRKF